MRLLMLAACAPLVLAQGLMAQAKRNLDPPPVYAAPRAQAAVRVDGRASEPDWQRAPAAGLIFPWESQKGAKQKTAVRLLWDETFLYATSIATMTTSPSGTGNATIRPTSTTPSNSISIPIPDRTPRTSDSK
jgi:hypothetical protein